ncbi:MAG: hypothetical protein PWQ70_2754 [Clostridiales bacterium]|jgi:hypothetical protein|nr:hypothetical protein [Clostridiales bacterium]
MRHLGGVFFVEIRGNFWEGKLKNKGNSYLYCNLLLII